jgi:hypothetical protein
MDETEDGDALWSLADLLTPMAIRVAATLRMADHVAGGMSTAAEVAEAEHVDTDALDRLMRHLVSAHLLDRDASGQYSLTALGEGLREDHPSGARGRLDIDGAIGRADLSFVHLLHSLRTGEASFPALFGREFWDDLASDAARTASYDAQMGADVAAWAPAVLAARDWGPLGHVIDVGGGDGTLLAALLRAHPSLRGTVFDQPSTAQAARTTLTAAGLADRSDVVPGSFFDPLPAGAGAYVLSAILHDWNDESARAILRRCAEAAGKAGIVFVVEKTGADGESPRTSMDLRMLAYFGGRERGVAELTALAASAGLRRVAVHRGGDLSIIEFTASRTHPARPAATG